MANAQPLIQWLLTNASRLKLQIDQLSWVEEVLPDYTDLRIQVSIGEQTHTGFASALSEDLALVKAAAEALERAVWREYGFSTTNGLAAHVTAEQAITSAKNELIERDTILCHFYAREPFQHLPAAELEPSILKPLSGWYQKHGIQFSLFELEPGGVLFVADGRNRPDKPFGFVLGAGLKGNIRESIESAAFEATRQLAHLLELPAMPAKSLEYFLKISAPSFRDHGDLALDLNYAAEIAGLFDNLPQRKINPLRDQDVQAGLVSSRLPELEGCPLFFAKAVSTGAQDIFLGAPKPEHINTQRIFDFLGCEISRAKICRLPHPFN